MWKSFLDFLANGITVRQRDYLLSLIVIVPIAYVWLMEVDTNFLKYDIVTRFMLTAVFSFFFVSFSVVYLWMLRRIEKRQLRHGTFYYIAPAIIVGIFYDDAHNLYNSSPLYTVFIMYVWFYAPFAFYGGIMRFMRYIDNKADEARNNRNSAITDTHTEEHSE